MGIKPLNLTIRLLSGADPHPLDSKPYKYFLLLISSNLIATASASHHQLLGSPGATKILDYKNADFTTQILNYAKSLSIAVPAVPFVLDCIGSKAGTLAALPHLPRSHRTVPRLQCFCPPL